MIATHPLLAASGQFLQQLVGRLHAHLHGLRVLRRDVLCAKCLVVRVEANLHHVVERTHTPLGILARLVEEAQRLVRLQDAALVQTL